jgi:sugar O-acyltransferase (sialic acid O-acetyltransferase NeuD family)
VGFLDENPTLWGAPIGGALVLGGLDRVAHFPRARLLLGTGRGRSRAALFQRLAEMGVTADRYTSVIHPRAVVPPSCLIGAGSVLLAGAVLTTDVTVGQHVAVMPNAVLTHDVMVEDYVSVCAAATLGGAVRVRTGTYLGQSCTVRAGLTLGSWSMVGIGSAVVHPVGDCQLWDGVPARLVGPSEGPPAPRPPAQPPAPQAALSPTVR